MKLYSLSGSRYGSRVAIQIAAKGLDIPIELVPMPMTDAFAQKNPLRLVPVLETDDGQFMPESQVICEYLEDLGEGPSLRPDDAQERARMCLLIRLFELYYDPALLAIYNLLFKGNKLDKQMVMQQLERLRTGLGHITRYLKAEKYAVGDTLSLADCALMPPFLQTRLLFPSLGLGDPIGEDAIASAYYDATLADPFVAPVINGMTPPLKGWFGTIVFES